MCFLVLRDFLLWFKNASNLIKEGRELHGISRKQMSWRDVLKYQKSEWRDGLMCKVFVAQAWESETQVPRAYAKDE